MNEFEFAILGAGAVGSIIGAHLSRSGHSVILLARGQRAAQISERGLQIRGLADFSQSVPVLADPSKLRSAWALIVATKTYNTRDALAPVRGAAIHHVLSIQNGLLKNDQLAECFTPRRVLGCFANLSGELLPSGEIMFTRNVQIYLGELSGRMSMRARRTADALDRAGLHAYAVENIQSLEWSKFAAWVGMMVVSVTTRTFTWEYMVDPNSALLLARLMREIGILAQHNRIPLSDESILPVATICEGSEQEAVEVVRQIGAALRTGAPKHRMSTLQDLEAGRSLEIEETPGFALRLAQQSNLSLPLLSSFYGLLAALTA